jgi:sulfur carrier protein
MLIVLNGQNCDVKSTTLDQILIECNYINSAIATALNDTIVHRQARVETVLNEGDRLEVVAPIGGG